MNLGKRVKVTRLVVATPVGTTAINGGVLDMSGFEGVLFIAEANTITDGGLTLKAQGGLLPDGSDMADLAGTAVAEAITDDNKCVLLDIYHPLQRYIRPVLVRAGATGAVVDSVLAIQYESRITPTVHDAATVANLETWASPLPGTA